MQLIVIKMRDRGVVIPKSRLQEGIAWQGYLSVQDTQQNHLHRLVKTARLFRDEEGTTLIDTLIDPTLVWANDNRFMLSGFEHCQCNTGDVDYAQSWLCMIGWQQSLKNDDGRPQDHGPISRKRGDRR